MSPGRYLVISVSDTGPGIQPEIRDRVFEPFFTTKGQEGTGMGLAMVYGIARNHGGTIEFETEVGRGTTFRVYLPTSGGPETPEARERPVEPAKERCRILVVDDEEMVLEATRDMLVELGYEVVTARDGPEAIDCYRSRRDEIDLVIIDLVMPKMSGRDCLRALKEIDPNVRAIAATGYGLDGVVQGLLDEGAACHLKKPYSAGDLAGAVARALEKH
jgi:CheY-like chemotaxis protein